MNLPRFLRTVRHLRAVQIVARLRAKLPRRAARVDGAVALRRVSGIWLAPPAWRARSLFDGELRLLNERVPLRDAGVWTSRDRAPLLLYNLHYHDDLTAAGAASRAEAQRELVAKWMRENPAGRGIGWDAFPTSLRIVNWIKWLLGGNAPTDGQLESLALQAEHLSSRLERHLLANHLLENAKALLFVGVALDTPQAERWRRIGASLFARELAEQVLDDGGHFERSPMYHAIVLEDLLDVENLRRAWPERTREVPPLGAPIASMLQWLRVMSHPDDRIALFNDATLSLAPPRPELIRYAALLGVDPLPAPEPLTHLAASGYARLENRRAVVILDAGELGPPYQPGHAHADTLSFELSLDDRRLIVNSGTSTYDAGPQREVDRGTAAKNTVVVDGRDSSEVWASFRVGRRAHVSGVDSSSKDNILTFRACHDGYAPARHCRTWRLEPGRLVVTDRIDGRFRTAEARLHFAPDVEVELEGEVAQVRTPAGARVRVDVRGGTCALEAGSYHPDFRVTLPIRVLRIAFGGAECETTITWEPV